MFTLPLSTIIELVLAALLAPTLVYCALVERRLRNLRKDQESLNATVRALNTAIAGAQSCLASLRGAAKDADQSLGARISTARLLADELSVLAASGERIASRMEGAREANPKGGQPGGANASLRAVR